MVFWPLAHVVIFISFPRLYLGLHYLTDILAGAALGGGICWLANRTRLLSPVTQKLLRMSSSTPGFFYAGFFLVTYQIATLFQELRGIGSGAWRFFRALAGDFG